MKWVGLLLGIILLAPAIAFCWLALTDTISLAIVTPSATYFLVALAAATLMGAVLVLASARAFLRPRKRADHA